jgi:hypothetical protein
VQHGQGGQGVQGGAWAQPAPESVQQVGQPVQQVGQPEQSWEQPLQAEVWHQQSQPTESWARQAGVWTQPQHAYLAGEQQGQQQEQSGGGWGQEAQAAQESQEYQGYQEPQAAVQYRAPRHAQPQPQVSQQSSQLQPQVSEYPERPQAEMAQHIQQVLQQAQEVAQPIPQVVPQQEQPLPQQVQQPQQVQPQQLQQPLQQMQYGAGAQEYQEFQEHGAYQPPQPPPPLPPQNAARQPTNTLALAGAVTSIVPLLGLVLSILGLTKARVLGVGRAVAQVGIALSVLFTLAWGVGGYYVYKVADSTAADPGCVSADADYLQYDAQMEQDASAMTKGGVGTPAFTAAVKTYQSDLTTLIGDFTVDAGKAGHADVRTAIQGVSSDLMQLDTGLGDLASGNYAGASHVMDLNSKLMTDFQHMESLCTTLSNG